MAWRSRATPPDIPRPATCRAGCPTSQKGTPMTQSHHDLDHDEIARIAEEIWDAEGRPEGCDHDHWMRARRILEERRSEAAPAGVDGAAPESGAPDGARPVQPGFEDVPPGIVPRMKAEDPEELHEEPGGRFASQLADLPDEAPAAPAPESAREPSES